MKKILIFLLTFICLKTFSQSVVPLRGDTIRVYKQGGTATLKVDSIILLSKYRAGASTDSVLTWDPISKTIKMRDASSFGGGSVDLSVADTLLPRDARWDIVLDALGDFYKQHRQVVYNVKDYGATGDGVTDDQPFIQAAIDDCHLKGGGVVYFPNGQYLLTAQYVTGKHLFIPISSVDTTEDAVTIELRGETPPMMWTNPLGGTGTQLPPLTGVLLKSSVLSNVAIIGSSLDGASSTNFTNLIVRNIGFRVRSKTGVTQVAPIGTAIDGRELAMMSVDYCRFDTESPRDSTVMPNSVCTGIFFPRVNNWCQINFTNSLITGYYKALVVGEHFKSNNCELDGNFIGLNTWSESQFHPIEIAQMGFWRNAYNIYLEGSGRISITHAIFEDDTVGTPWFEFVADLTESPSTGSWSGSIGFGKNYSFSGAYDEITRSASTNSLITTYPFSNPLQTNGPGQGLVKSLISGDLAYTDFQSTGNSSVMRFGQASSTYGGFGALAANNGFMLSGNGDMTFLVTGGTKVKIGIGGSGAQTQEINTTGFKHSSSTTGALIGTIASGFPGVWLGDAVDAPTAANYTLLRSNASEATLINTNGTTPSTLFSTNGDITNMMVYDAPNRRLGIGGLAYNGSVTATLDLPAKASSSASMAPLKLRTASAVLLATPEAGAMEVLVDSLYWTGNSGTRYKVYPQTSGGTALSSITAAVGSNDIDNGTGLQEWRWNALGGNSGLKLSSTSTQAASNLNRILEVNSSGANTNASQTTVGIYSSNTKTGTTSTNYGLFSSASGATNNYGIVAQSGVAGGTNNIAGWFAAVNATNNYGIIVTGGNSGFNVGTPTMKLQVQGRFGQYYSSIGVSAANDLTLPDANGTLISGNTQINAITTTDWQQGSIVVLVFSGTPVVKNNTAGGGGTGVIRLAGGVDFNATANDVLTLIFDGAQWVEVSRSIN